MGYLPQAIVNYVALLGWNPKTTNQEIFSMAELIEHFSLEGLSKSPAVFDYDKLGWINGEYLKAMSDEDFAKMARPFAGELPDYLEQSWAHLASLLKTRIQRLGDMIYSVAEQQSMRVSTAVLNDLLDDAKIVNPPPAHAGRVAKIYYMTQVGIRPPTFVMFVNDANLIHFSYVRFIENRLRAAFSFEGTPIRIVLRSKKDGDEL